MERIDAPAFLEALGAAGSRRELWTTVVRRARVRRMAEVGVWEGHFAEAVLRGCPSVERYWMIDPWAPLPHWDKPFNVSREEFEAVYARALERTAFASDRVEVLRGETKDVVDAIPDGSLDLAYIDGDHTLRGIVIDLIRLWPKVRDGGLVGGDDLTSVLWQHGRKYEPTLVFPLAVHFAEAEGVPILAAPHGQFVMQKGGGGFSFIDPAGAYPETALRPLLEPSGGLVGRLRRLLGSLRG